MERMYAEVLDMNGRFVRDRHILLRPARRVRGPTAGGISCVDVSETNALLDRVDAITVLSRASYIPRMGLLIESANLVLG